MSVCLLELEFYISYITRTCSGSSFLLLVSSVNWCSTLFVTSPNTDKSSSFWMRRLSASRGYLHIGQFIFFLHHTSMHSTWKICPQLVLRHNSLCSISMIQTAQLWMDSVLSCFFNISCRVCLGKNVSKWAISLSILYCKPNWRFYILFLMIHPISTITIISSRIPTEISTGIKNFPVPSM